MVAWAAAAQAGGQALELLLQYLENQKADKRYKQSIGRAEQEKAEALQRLKDLIKMAKEGSGDTFGNRSVYQPGLGWTTKQTARSAKLTAGEQLARLRSQEIANRGAGDLTQARAKYLYGPRESQEELTSDYTNLGLLGRRKGLDEAGSVMARQMLRQGEGGDLADVYETGNRLYADSLKEELLKGKMAGREAFQDSEQFRTGQGQNEMNTFLNQALGGSGAGLEGLSSMGSNAKNALLAALGGKAGDTSWLSSAYSSNPKTGNYDISGLIDALTKMFGEDNTTTVAKNTSRYGGTSQNG